MNDKTSNDLYGKIKHCNEFKHVKDILRKQGQI